jgi:DNA-binding response OmpR family regulator
MNKPLPKVAILEDDPDCRTLLRYMLGFEHDVYFAQCGADLLKRVDCGSVDVVLLDIQLPREDGFSIARAIRRASRVPIVFVSALDADDAVVKGLNIGGDDYVTKPFSQAVLTARIRNLLRREPDSTQPPSAHVRVGEFRLDLDRSVLIDGKGGALPLTEMEARVLALLMQMGGVPVTRDDLYRSIHGRDWDRMSREIDVHVSNLRRKLELTFELTDAIRHVRGIGYRLSLTTFGAEI